MKNLMVTLALVIGLLSTSVSFADEVTSMDKAQTEHFVAFNDVKSQDVSEERLEQVSGEHPLLLGAAVVGGVALVGYGIWKGYTWLKENNTAAQAKKGNLGCGNNAFSRPCK